VSDCCDFEYVVWADWRVCLFSFCDLVFSFLVLSTRLCLPRLDTFPTTTPTLKLRGCPQFAIRRDFSNPHTTRSTGQSLTKQLYGWYSLKRSSFDKGFHTYAVEWDERFVRFYVDDRVKTVLEVSMEGRGGKGFWERGG
jgi:hypothetical protein